MALSVPGLSLHIPMIYHAQMSTTYHDLIESPLGNKTSYHLMATSFAKKVEK